MACMISEQMSFFVELKPKTRHSTVHTEENIGAVDDSVQEDSNLFIRHRS